MVEDSSGTTYDMHEVLVFNNVKHNLHYLEQDQVLLLATGNSPH